MKFFSAILDLIFPPRCVFCRKVLKPGEKGVCAACEKTLPRPSSGGAQEGECFSVCVSALYYEGIVRDSILRYKFHDAKGYADVYGAFLADCISENLTGMYDIITWTPLSAKRLKKRGYDQAMLLAMSAANRLGDVPAELLRKHTDVPAQSSLSGGAEARRANISGVYEVTDEELVRGRRILLIDDIVTTGSTLSECARTLRAFGAEDVVCATLARTR